MAGMHVRFEVSPQEFLDHLTEVAYRVALTHGCNTPFIDVALDLREAMRRVMEKDIMASESCGSQTCLGLKKESFNVWSEDSKKMFKEDE